MGGRQGLEIPGQARNDYKGSGMTRGMMVFGAQRPRGFGGFFPQWIKEARSADGFKSCGTRRESARRLAGAFFASWSLQDLNLRPADYESAAANQLS